MSNILNFFKEIFIDLPLGIVDSFTKFPKKWERISRDKVPNWININPARVKYNTFYYVKEKTFLYRYLKSSEVQGGKYYFWRKLRR